MGTDCTHHSHTQTYVRHKLRKLGAKLSSHNHIDQKQNKKSHFLFLRHRGGETKGEQKKEKKEREGGRKREGLLYRGTTML